MAAKVTHEELLEQYPDADEGDNLRDACPCALDSCLLKGHCRACVAWHRDHANKPLPYCLRDLDGVVWKPRE